MRSIGNSLVSLTPRTQLLRAGIVAALLGFAAVAAAQSPTSTAPMQKPSIQQQMTPAQFKAAGLDRLDAQQLASLNAWLNGAIETESAKAAVTAKKQVVDNHRGFLTFGSVEPIVSRISGEFRGFGSRRNYTLDNGQVWQQTDAATLASVRLSNPGIKITPSLVGNAWYLQVQGYNTRAKVQRVK